MSNVLKYGIAILILVLSSSCAQNTAGKTSSARAAYGTPAPFRSHVKKNKKRKRNAEKAGKRKKSKDPKQPYLRLPM